MDLDIIPRERNEAAIVKSPRKSLFHADDNKKYKKRTIGKSSSSSILIDRSRNGAGVIARKITRKGWGREAFKFTIVPTVTVVSIKGNAHESWMFSRHGRALPSPLVQRNGWPCILSRYRVIL
ncbi:uncharacterized protein LOC107043220 [Diachasma alloeum]|uniref:uncharacterized protein LOC107043220 n=1 Tax=Diachasma alloeum TaxID=454923 RepID=UPI0007380F79|nr:uncharacterized protein LOC107043220 [Diachasma alloeum]